MNIFFYLSFLLKMAENNANAKYVEVNFTTKRQMPTAPPYLGESPLEWDDENLPKYEPGTITVQPQANIPVVSPDTVVDIPPPPTNGDVSCSCCGYGCVCKVSKPTEPRPPTQSCLSKIWGLIILCFASISECFSKIPERTVCFWKQVLQGLPRESIPPVNQELSWWRRCAYHLWHFVITSLHMFCHTLPKGASYKDIFLTCLTFVVVIPLNIPIWVIVLFGVNCTPKYISIIGAVVILVCITVAWELLLVSMMFYFIIVIIGYQYVVPTIWFIISDVGCIMIVMNIIVFIPVIGFSMVLFSIGMIITIITLVFDVLYFCLCLILSIIVVGTYIVYLVVLIFRTLWKLVLCCFNSRCCKTLEEGETIENMNDWKYEWYIVNVLTPLNTDFLSAIEKVCTITLEVSPLPYWLCCWKKSEQICFDTECLEYTFWGFLKSVFFKNTGTGNCREYCTLYCINAYSNLMMKFSLSK